MERLIETPESEDDICFDPFQPLVLRPKILGTVPSRDFISGSSQIANHEFVLPVSLVKEGLEIARVLHAIREASSDDGDMVAFLQFQRGSGEGDVGQGEQSKEKSVHAGAYRLEDWEVKAEESYQVRCLSEEC